MQAGEHSGYVCGLGGSLAEGHLDLVEHPGELRIDLQAEGLDGRVLGGVRGEYVCLSLFLFLGFTPFSSPSIY